MDSTYHCLNLDIETYSDVDIKTAGLYKYAQSPAFEVLLFGYSLNGGPRIVVDLTAGETGTTAGTGATDGTAAVTAGTTPAPAVSDDPIKPSDTNNHTTTYTIDASTYTLSGDGGVDVRDAAQILRYAWGQPSVIR